METAPTLVRIEREGRWSCGWPDAGLWSPVSPVWVSK